MIRRLATITGLAVAACGIVMAIRLLAPRRARRRNWSPAPAAGQRQDRRDAWAMWVERRTSFADIVDEASDCSFPASDPPAYLPPDRIGAPKD